MHTICLVFCDMSKAFDRVWHRSLIQNLKKTWNLWRSYRLDSKLSVYVEPKSICQRHFLITKFILAGVPQGSDLGLLFFLIYINDLADYLHGMARLFADDTFLSFSSNNLIFIEHILNTDLVKLKEWAKKWLIKINPLKTEVMVFSNIHNDYDIELSYDENFLKIVETHKYLGFTISSNNKWSKHKVSIINSASKQISYLRKLKFKLPKRTLNKLCCTYIRPLLECASEEWDGCYLSDTNRLEQVQLNAARIVTGLPVFSSFRSLDLETGWKTLAETRGPWWSYIAHLSKQLCTLTVEDSAKFTALRFLYKFYSPALQRPFFFSCIMMAWTESWKRITKGTILPYWNRSSGFWQKDF